MITFVNEDTEKVSSRRIVIPKNAKRIFKAMKDLYSDYVDTTKGGKVLKKLGADTHYDGKGDEAKKNGQETDNTSITVNNAKVILHRQNKFAPNTVQYQLYGGKLGHDILKRGIERSRAQSSVSEVPKVQQPKPVAPPKPNSDSLKPASPKLAESAERNVVLSESQIRLLKEYRSQLVLPFNGEENGQGHKANYEHFIDYLEENGRYGTLEAEHADIDELLDQSVSFENVTDFDAKDSVGLWLIGNFVSDLLTDGYDLLDIFSEEWIEGFELASTTPLEIGQEIVDHLEVPTIDDFEVTLSSDQMCDKFEVYAINTLKEMLTEHFHGSHRGYSRSIQVDENGLIEVERAITLPNLASQSHAPGSEFTDFYDYLTKSFKGRVGECWSWSYGDTYDGDDYGNGTTTVYLKGKVQPSSVDWSLTAMLNLDLYLNDEDEIRLKRWTDVEIDDILGSDHESLGILKQPIICKA